MPKPLEGIVVLDLTRVLSGPYCTMQLADMGAEVLKIEMPGRGDDTRHFGPPFRNGESAYFLSINRNKKSITLNLKSEKGKAILRRLIPQADILVENFRPGTLDNLGFGYETLSTLNPRLIYCAISGFGHTGPDRLRPGYDLVVQGEGGVMSLTGEPDGPPYKVGVSFADIVAGMVAVQGILLALLAREKSGKGQKVDISMLDCQVSLLTYQAGIYFFTGQSPFRMGNLHPTLAPYETFKCQDEYINVAVGNDSLWARFCQVIDLPHLQNDARFVTNEERVKNHAALKEILDRVFAQKTRQEWLTLLQEAGIPCGAIKTVAEVCNDPQVLAREMVVEIEHPTVGKTKVPGVPVKLSDTPGGVETPPPLLGEHTEEVLSRMLGLQADEIAALREEKVI
ncbi:MAG: CoA transferase [Nitrospinota bacterium]|nr:MAG: CoA transferase [Nitrospinota bacterium]